MNNDVNAIKKFKGIRISHLKNHANFVKILQETTISDSNQNIDKLQKLQKEIDTELDILNNLVAGSHLKISDILKLDPDEENDRLLALKSNEVELLNAVGKDENSQLNDSIQAKTDAQQDQILSQLLMKRYGEAEWNIMSQKEKQQRILKARMEILKESVDDKNWTENINLSNDTKFILGELEKDTNLKAKMIEGQKARQAALLEEKKRNIREGRMTEAEAQAEFKLQEKKIQEQFSDTKNVLHIIQFDADAEKRKILNNLVNANSAQERERLRQLELGKQRLLKLNAKKDATENMMFELLGNKSNVEYSNKKERDRQKKLAKARLDLYRKRKEDMKTELADKEILLDSSIIEDSIDQTNIPIEITKLIDVWQSEELEHLLRFVDSKANPKIVEIFNENLDLNQLREKLKTIADNWNQAKTSNSAKTRAWNQKRDYYLEDATAVLLVMSCVDALSKFDADPNQAKAEDAAQKRQNLSQKVVEEKRLELVADLETAHRRFRLKISETMETKNLFSDNQKMLKMYQKLEIQRAYFSNLGIILLGPHNINVDVDENEIVNDKVIQELENKYDVAKLKIIQENLVDLISQENFDQIDGSDDLLMQILEKMEESEKDQDNSEADTSLLKIAYNLAKNNPKWGFLKQLLKNAKAAQNKIKDKAQAAATRARLKKIANDMNDEKAQLLGQLNSAHSAREKERSRQLAMAKLRKEKRLLQKENDAFQIDLLLEANKVGSENKEAQRKIQIEIAKKRLEALAKKKQEKKKKTERAKEIQIIKDDLFKKNNVVKGLKRQLLLSSDDSDINISRIDFIDLEQKLEKDFVVNCKEIYDFDSPENDQSSTKDLEERLDELAFERKKIIDENLALAIDRQVKKSSIKSNEQQDNKQQKLLAKQQKLDIDFMAERQIQLNRILQEAISIKNELSKRASKDEDADDYWQNLLADLADLQNQQQTVLEDVSANNNELLDKVIIESNYFEVLGRTLFSKSDNQDTSNWINDIENISTEISSKLSVLETKDADNLQQVQEILARRRLSTAESEATSEKKSPSNEDETALKESDGKTTKPKKTIDAAQEKLKELQQIEMKRQATLVREKTSLAEKIARRREAIKNKKAGEAQELMKQHEEQSKAQQIQLERQKTKLKDQTMRLVRERTRIKREKTLVRDGENSEDKTISGPKFEELKKDEDALQKKAQEMQEKFEQEIQKQATAEIAQKIDDFDENKMDEAIMNANAEPVFESQPKEASRASKRVVNRVSH